MSILVSKLVSVFTADTNDLKKGYDETRRGAKEVTSELKKTEEQASKTGDSFLSMAKKAAGFLAAAVAAGKSAQQIISEAANIVAIDNFAYAINESVESVDAFNNAIVATGGSVQGAQSSLSALFSKVKEASRDSASSAALDFAKIGVSIKDAQGNTKDLMSILYDISGVVENMDSQKAREYIESVGITDRNVVEAMIRGRKELETMIKAQKELGVVSKESAEKARAFDAAVGRMSLSFKRAKVDITDAFLPAFEWVADKMEWVGGVISENSTIIIGAIGGIAIALAVMLIPVLWSTAAAVIAATWPFLLIIGIVALVGAGLYALYEDFKAFEDGQESFLGKMMNKYPNLAKSIIGAFKTIGKVFDWISEKIKWAMEAIGIDMKDSEGIISTVINAILGLLEKFAGCGIKLVEKFGESWDLMKAGLSDLYNFFKDTFNAIWDAIKPIIDMIAKALGVIIEPFRWLGEKVGLWGGDEPEVNIDPNFEENRKGRSNVNTLMGFVGEDTRAELEKAMIEMGEVSGHPLNSITSNQIRNATTKSESKSYNLDVGEIKIETAATDTQGIAMGIAGALKDQLQSIEAESNTGIAR